ncbi:hypothetical protein D3C83_285730 [compost metagenome]
MSRDLGDGASFAGHPLDRRVWKQGGGAGSVGFFLELSVVIASDRLPFLISVLDRQTAGLMT